jgi:hypothetical protein
MSEMKKILIVIYFLQLVGCTQFQINTQKYSSLDSREKSITVPAGSEGLRGKVKQVLSDDGWKLMVDKGPNVLEGKLSESVKLESYGTFNTRYRILIKSNQIDMCIGIPLSPLLKFDISLVDNKTGSEVITMSGLHCEPEIIDKFRIAIHSLNK